MPPEFLTGKPGLRTTGLDEPYPDSRSFSACLCIIASKGKNTNTGLLAAKTSWPGGPAFLPGFQRAKGNPCGAPVIPQVPRSHLLPAFVLLLILVYLGRILVQSEWSRGLFHWTLFHFIALLRYNGLTVNLLI